MTVGVVPLIQAGRLRRRNIWSASGRKEGRQRQVDGMKIGKWQFGDKRKFVSFNFVVQVDRSMTPSLE